MYQFFFELIYRLIIQQNEMLIKNIAKNEGIPEFQLKTLLPSKRALKHWLQQNQ